MDEKEIREMFGMGELITPRQFRSLHLWFKWVADAANEAGIPMAQLIDIIRLNLPVTPLSFKEAIFKPVALQLYGRESTKDLLTTECIKLTDSFNLALNERLKLELTFPSEEQTDSYLKSLKQ